MHSFELRLGAIVHDNDLSPSSDALQRSDDLLDLPYSGRDHLREECGIVKSQDADHA